MTLAPPSTTLDRARLTGDPAAFVPTILGLATAAPPQSYDQREMLALLGLTGDEFAESIFARCGVERRHLGTPPELWSTTLQARTPHTERLLAGLAFDAVEQLGCERERIGVVVTGTYWSLGGPTLAHRLVERFGLDPSADKYHVHGVGCASGVPLLRLASQALRERPSGTQALVVAAEVASGLLTTCTPGDEKVKIVSSSLLGDGCAAALVELGDGDGSAGGAAGPAIAASAVHQLPGTLDDVRFAITGDDSYLNMSRALPVIAERDLPALVDDFLARNGGLARAGVDHWVAHPGGRGILDGIKAGLGLCDEDVAPSATVLAQRGNVGTPSALYVLEQTQRLRAPAPGDRGLMITIGPGVTIGLALLQW
jgi:predicted naringenin-chalcone synthase